MVEEGGVVAGIWLIEVTDIVKGLIEYRVVPSGKKYPPRHVNIAKTDTP